MLSQVHTIIRRSDATNPETVEENVKFEWSADCENVFNLAKKRLAQDPMLYHPDPNKPWIIETDASKTAFADILLQPHELRWSNS